ncbi:hypothetical protein ACFQ7O_24055 [Streptomyces sp. NPDC056485]|uniref:hypothetical protein n=1 Tax=Streptomyces sp. NPDC056485 TaxID=3345834 RepID=UPI003696CF8D
MSDSQDQIMKSVAHRLAVVYTGLFTTCENLPIPIALPDGGDAADIKAVVARVSQIAEEQPVPEEQQAQLFTAAVMWLAAADLYSILKMDFLEARADAALGILLIARDAVTALGEWLIEMD